MQQASRLQTNSTLRPSRTINALGFARAILIDLIGIAANETLRHRARRADCSLAPTASLDDLMPDVGVADFAARINRTALYLSRRAPMIASGDRDHLV
jgi:hypothetical protein